MGLLACVLRPSGPPPLWPPCSFLPSPGDAVSMVPNLVSYKVRSHSDSLGDFSVFTSSIHVLWLDVGSKCEQ
jgi:hypothetical protein